MTDAVQLVCAARALNGERPGWHPTLERLFWVNIREPALHVFDPTTGKDTSFEMPAWIGCHAVTPTGAIVALRTGLYDFQPYHGRAHLHGGSAFRWATLYFQ